MSSAGRTPHRAVWALSGIVALLGVLTVASAQSALAVEPGADGSNISVTVTDGSTAEPTTPPTEPPLGGSGSNSTPGGSIGSGGSGSSGGASSNGQSGPGTDSPGTSAGDPTSPTDEVSVNGMLYVGGLESSSVLAVNPAEAAVTLLFTVRNASQGTIDASADFKMSSIFGNELDVAHGVSIEALLPGETRVVSAQLHGAGQWTLVSAQMTLTPPEMVDGVALEPVSRDALVFVFPWLIAVMVAVVLVGVVLVPRLVRGMQMRESLVTSA